MATTRDQVVIELVAQTKKAMGSLKKMGLAVGAIIATVKTFEVVAKKAFESVQLANALDDQGIAFNQLAKSAGVASEEVLASMQEMTNGTITRLDLMRTASQANLLGIGFTEMPKLLEIARASAVATGQSLSFMFDSIVTGIGRGSPLILDNLGIILKIGEANQNYAEQLGKTVEEMTTAEKKQAILNATLIAGEDIINKVGTAVDGMTRVEKVDALKTSFQERKTELGERLAPMAGRTFEIFTKLFDLGRVRVQIVNEQRESQEVLNTISQDWMTTNVEINELEQARLLLQSQINEKAEQQVILAEDIASTTNAYGKMQSATLTLNELTNTELIEEVKSLKNKLVYLDFAILRQKDLAEWANLTKEEQARIAKELAEQLTIQERNEDMARKRERILEMIGNHEEASLFNLKNQLETLKEEAEWLEFVENQGTKMEGWTKEWGMAMTVVLAKIKKAEEEIRKIEFPNMKTDVELGFDEQYWQDMEDRFNWREEAEKGFQEGRYLASVQMHEEQKRQLEEIREGWEDFFDTLSQGALVDGVNAFRQMGVAIAQGKDMTDALANSILGAVADAMQLLAVELAINGAKAIGMGNVGLGVSMLLASAGVGLFGGMLSGIGGTSTASSAPSASTMGTASATQKTQPARTVVINNTTVSGSYIASRNVGMRVT